MLTAPKTLPSAISWGTRWCRVWGKWEHDQHHSINKSKHHRYKEYFIMNKYSNFTVYTPLFFFYRIIIYIPHDCNHNKCWLLLFLFHILYIISFFFFVRTNTRFVFNYIFMNIYWHLYFLHIFKNLKNKNILLDYERLIMGA